MQNKNLGQEEQKQLTKRQRREFKKMTQQQVYKKEQNQKLIKKVIKIIIIILIAGAGIFVLIWFALSRPKLPPTTLQGHIEQSPLSHILNQPMAEVIQKHMLEHADGKGDPGIIIQYNCVEFKCEPDLIEKLTELVEDYPNNVYLAPNNYSGKIILTKFGKRDILEEFNEEKIRNFIK